MEPLNTFEQFVQQVKKTVNYKKALVNYEEQHNLKKFKFTGISPEDAMSIFRGIIDKFYKGYGPRQSGTWFENQLRLYLWALVCYMELYGKQLSLMQETDWQFFATVFYVKEKNLFEYQAKSLLDDSKQRWQTEEDLMLYNIIMGDPTAKWNEIAKTLFIFSGKRYLRTSKQCRERWLNHLDPNKTKSQWNLKQYQILFQQVLKKGKKWAHVVKSLHDRRSEHSIKNKYNSIMRKQQKLTPDLTEAQICTLLLQKIIRMAESSEFLGSEEYIFGNTNKFIGLNTKCKDNIQKVIIKKREDEQVQESKKKFQTFRKKLATFQFNDIQNSGLRIRTPKKNLIKKQKKEYISPSPLRRQKQKAVPHQIEQDQIFYDDSFEGVLIQPQQNHLIFTEDLKNLIKQCDL